MSTAAQGAPGDAAEKAKLPKLAAGRGRSVGRRENISVTPVF